MQKLCFIPFGKRVIKVIAGNEVSYWVAIYLSERKKARHIQKILHDRARIILVEKWRKYVAFVCILNAIAIRHIKFYYLRCVIACPLKCVNNLYLKNQAMIFSQKNKNRVFTGYQSVVSGEIPLFHRCLDNKRI